MQDPTVYWKTHGFLFERDTGDPQRNDLFCNCVERKPLYKWSAPNLLKKFRTLLMGIEIGPLTGSCGTAASKRKSVVADIEQNPLWATIKDRKGRRRKGLLVLSIIDSATRSCNSPSINKRVKDLPRRKEYTGKSKEPVDDHFGDKVVVENESATRIMIWLPKPPTMQYGTGT